MLVSFFFFFKQKTAYELRFSDGSSDVCSSDLGAQARRAPERRLALRLPPPACEVRQPGTLFRLRARPAPHRASAIAAGIHASRGARAQWRSVALRCRAVAALCTTRGQPVNSVVPSGAATIVLSGVPISCHQAHEPQKITTCARTCATRNCSNNKSITLVEIGRAQV